MENPKFQIFVGKDDQFYFRLRAANGEIILQSEGYTTKAACQNGIESVKENAVIEKSFTKFDNLYYFNLEARNGEIIGKSEMYSTKQARDNGIESVTENAPIAPVEDIT